MRLRGSIAWGAKGELYFPSSLTCINLTTGFLLGLVTTAASGEEFLVTTPPTMSLGLIFTTHLINILIFLKKTSECYKTLELNKQEIEQLRFWCQYWILFGLLRELGVFADILFSWLPFYYGAKLGAFLYLWHPRTKGATFVYETFLAPFIAEHESEIDPSLFEFRARAADWGLIAWQMAVSYLQTSVPEMKKYAISLMPTMNSIEEPLATPVH
ncbi:putative HVA22-like protein g [Zingiber officinale]|uniref:putative HVA22-like protein g n=1 Tax=Zingiber officinale TaxID=94328 RepID=UPI001C4BA96A|nr:putative HVA22-like protein g [Zingiber officinale]XP_042383646.1 putative HVA22-like protein g [Zingiber officinale]XP_042383647.1 putative HVA22-like protein g [Zingiber officinale]